MKTKFIKKTKNGGYEMKEAEAIISIIEAYFRGKNWRYEKDGYEKAITTSKINFKFEPISGWGKNSRDNMLKGIDKIMKNIKNYENKPSSYGELVYEGRGKEVIFKISQKEAYTSNFIVLMEVTVNYETHI